MYCFLFGLEQSSLDALESRNAALELALKNSKKETEDSIKKLCEVEEKSSLLQENVKRYFYLFPWDSLDLVILSEEVFLF